jgi:hypothetical protein
MGSTPVRKPHTNTSDLLTWSEVPPPQSSPAVSATRSRQVTIFIHSFVFFVSTFDQSLIYLLHLFKSQPSDRISKVLTSDQLTEEDAQTLAKRYFLPSLFLC